MSVTVVAVTAYGLTVIVRKGWSTVFASTDPVPARKVASPPTLASMESRVRTEHDLAHRVQAGVPSTFALIKGGAGERLILPPNSAGITEVIVELDPSGQTVWLAYGGEVTGKGTRGLPRGAVEQLVRDRPTVLVFTFSTPTMSRGVEWVLGMVEVSDSQESAADLFTTKWPDDWATRFRNEWISKSGSGPAAVPADAGGVTR
ncbi:MAG: hypothetical protein FJ253_11335 [Phycisphaerae bacterium]|nr:hypothetical protein [Phycisphaerae bacterium]